MNAATMTAPEGQDFPDWVNPFVVKELRQGLRSKIFVSVFVALHGCVALGMLMGFLISGDSEVPFRMSHAMQWITEIACVCVLLPMGGYAAVAEELKADSLELIRVAGVSSGQIVMGKWQAQLSQATLLLVSVSPYHLLGYYTNHEGPLAQMAGLYSCWLFSLLMTAMMMFYATLKLAGRMGCVFFGVPLMLFLMATVLAPVLGMAFQSGNASVAAVIIETVIGVAGLTFFLSLAVSGFDMRVRAEHAPLPQPNWYNRGP